MNRRYHELEKEHSHYTKRLDEADTISDSLIYQGKLEAIEKEMAEIKEKYQEAIL